MEAKHTPGPWEITEPKHPDLRQIEDRLIFANIGDERLHIAEVYQYQNHNNREANGTALANARLIAAAPELVEALQAVYACLVSPACDSCNSQLAVDGKTLKTIEAALAKAENKTAAAWREATPPTD